MNDSSPDHERHDPLRIAAQAAGDLTGRDRETADALVRHCADCAALAADLRALATAVHDLPRPARPRDFTLTPADATRLRRGGWRRVREVVRGDRFRFARPIGAGLASLGFAGLVFASTIGGVVPSDGASGSAGAAGIVEELAAPSDITTFVEDGGTSAGGDAPSPAALEAQRQTAGERDADPGPDVAGDVPAATTSAAANPNEAIIVVSGSLFIVGIGIYGLRWTSDRLDG